MMKKLYFSILTLLFLANSNEFNAQGVDYFLKASGTLTNEASWGTNSDGTGTSPVDFVQGDFFHITNNAGLALNTAWDVGGGDVYIGDGTSAISFTLGSGASFVNNFFLEVTNNSTFVLNREYNLIANTNKAVGSKFVYGPGATDLKKVDYYDLQISNNVSVLGGGGTVTVNGDLTIDSGVSIDLSGSGRRLLLNGAIAGTGTIKGDNAGSTLVLRGSGNVGTLNFASGFETLTILTVSLATSTSSVTISTDLALTGTVSGNGLRLVSGILNLSDPVGGGHQLTVNNAAVFTGGSFAGDFQSSLLFNSTISGSMLMDASSDTLAYLILNSSGQTLTLGNQLNIIDSISPILGTIAAGANNLRLISTSQLKGRLGRVGPSGALTGTMTVETFIPSGTTGWGNLGISGIKNQTVANWEDDIPMTCVNCPFGPMSTGFYFVSINTYDEPSDTYNTAVTFTDPLTPALGFWVYLGDGPTTSNPLTLVNTGEAVTGNTAIAVTAIGTGSNGSYNLVANPYASPINWNLVSAANTDIGDVIYAYSAGGQYADYNATSQLGNNGLTNEIPMGQGFYVTSVNGSGSLDFTESMKCANSNDPEIIKRPVNTNNKYFRMKIKGNNLDHNEMIINMNPDATPVFDKYDTKKLFSSPGYAGYPGVYSQYTTISSKDALNNDYSTQSIPLLSQSVTISILAKAMLTGQYTITATEFDDIENCLLLKDKTTGSIHDLKSGPLVVTLNDTVQTPRFELMMCRDANPVGIAELKASSNIFINQDADGAFVRTNFSEPTTATISAYNIIGQQLTNDVVVEGTVNTTRLNLGVHNQVVLIKVTTGNESVVKKIVVH